MADEEEKKSAGSEATDHDDEDEEAKRAEEERKRKEEEEKKAEEEAEEEEDGIEGIVDDAGFLAKMGTERYITFSEFAKIMSLFNPRTGIDEKIQFYFRIFDVNEDKKIDKADLNKIMRMLFGSKLSKEDIVTLGDKIFNEVIQSSEKDYLDQDDVQKILWSTNIEHKCSMHFFQS
mmetsp:Transcript_14303/g.22273  ORF Transcript_14303/g.22273 Transcript_14303/m.22273 type:complete len:176 (-) Transcript_14303:8-535(-)